jgi:hypothetical protein
MARCLGTQAGGRPELIGSNTVMWSNWLPLEMREALLRPDGDELGRG